MTVWQLQQKFNFSYLSKGEDKEIVGGFCGDLLSWVMANAQTDNVWFTVMGNINAIAVASLNDVACIVLCQSSQINDDALAKAKEEGITVLSTDLPTFVACGKFYQATDGQ
ncbi:MAG: hypothetical protein RR846_04420 [Oscillospiraceae bacterium]